MKLQIKEIKGNSNISAEEKKELLFWAWDLVLAQNKKSEKMKSVTYLNKNKNQTAEKKTIKNEKKGGKTFPSLPLKKELYEKIRTH